MPSVSDFDLIIVDEAHRGYILDRQMSEEERIWANALSDAIEPAKRIRTENKGPLPGNSQKRHVRNRPDDEHHQPGISRRSGTPSRDLHGKGMTPP